MDVVVATPNGSAVSIDAKRRRPSDAIAQRSDALTSQLL